MRGLWKRGSYWGVFRKCELTVILIILELKCAHLSPTWYAPKPWRLQEEAQGKSCLVVEKRAEKVAAARTATGQGEARAK